MTNAVVVEKRYERAELPELLVDAIDPMFIIYGDSFIDCNNAALTLFKFANRYECQNTQPWQMSPMYQPDGSLSMEKAKDKIESCYQQGKQRFLWLHQNTLQELIWVEVTIVKLNRGGNDYIHATLRDVVHQPNYTKQTLNGELNVASTSVEQQVAGQLLAVNPYIRLLQEHKKVIDASAIVSKTTPDGVITYVNENFCRISGYEEQELLGQKHSIIRHPEMTKATFKQLWHTISNGKIWQGVIKNLSKSGETYIVKSTVAPIFSNEGRIAEFIAIRQDVTEIYQQKRIIHQQNIDPITKVKHFSRLLVDINQKSPCHVAIIDVPDLSAIQNAYDIKEYYRVMAKVANRINNILPSEISLYRNSDRSFALLTPSETPFNLFIKQCIHIQNSVENEEFSTFANIFSLSLHIGLAQWAPDVDLLSRARMALVGGEELNQKLSIFTPENNIHSRLLATIEWTNRLKSAIATNGIAIFGQTIVDKSLMPYSTEVLMRYFDPDKQQYISPIEFLGHAKRSKIYASLSRVVIEKAFVYFAHKGERFSLNLSKADISDRYTARLILSLIDKYQLGKNVVIELVESENYELDDQQFASFLLKLKAQQCQIAIDDFGSGYSNFEYLTRLPVDIIKIDGSLIKEIATNHKHQVIVNTIVNFCHSLDIKVVAEYVKDEQVLNKVKEFGVDMYQGYHFHQPERLD